MKNIRLFSLLFCLGSIDLSAGWDQSLDRWVSECNLGMGSRCALAGSLYESGTMIVWDGRANHSSKMPVNLSKALSYYKKGCDLGDRFACGDYHKLSAKITAKKTGPSPNTGSKTYSIPVAPLECDIDKDGKKERLYTVLDQKMEGGSFYQLQLYRSDGTLLWAGPRDRKFENPLTPYDDMGSQMPEIFADIDKDGVCELIISIPYTEVDLVFHHRFRWIHNRFVRLRDAALIQSNPPLGGHFTWRSDLGKNAIFHSWFVLELKPGKNVGEALTEIATVSDPKRYLIRRGKALMRFTRDGADLIRWIEVPH